MVKPSILDPAASYSFSQYSTLPFDTADILAEFGVAFQSASLQLPEQQPLDPTPLTHELAENLALVDPTSEIARRESLIFPVLKTVCKFIQSPLKIEYYAPNTQYELTAIARYQTPRWWGNLRSARIQLFWTHTALRDVMGYSS